MGVIMEIINMTLKQFEKCQPLSLSDDTTSTECKMYKFYYKGNEKVLKRLYITNGINFANKLYTLEALSANREFMPNNFILPDFLVSINQVVSGFAMNYINCINLSNILEDKLVDIEEKKYYLKLIGKILEQMKRIRQSTILNDFYLGDLHEDNFVVDVNKKEIYVVDLDSSKILGNQSSPGRYLTSKALLNNASTIKYKRTINDRLTDYKVDENTDLYCYIIIILNYLYNGKINNVEIDEFYRFINYLNDIGVNKELLKCFERILTNGNNINPCDYIDSLTSKQIAKARFLYKK